MEPMTIERLCLKLGDVYMCVCAQTQCFTEKSLYTVEEDAEGNLGLRDSYYDLMRVSSSLFIPYQEDTAPHDRIKVASDGGSTEYYTVPEHATELRHLISHKGMSKSRGDIFKACYRLGEKSGVDTLYDLNKMKFFVDDLIEMHRRGEHL